MQLHNANLRICVADIVQPAFGLACNSSARCQNRDPFVLRVPINLPFTKNWMKIQLLGIKTATWLQ